MPFTFSTTFAPNPTHPGTTHSLPLLLLRLEGATLFFSSIYLYHRLRRFYLAEAHPSSGTSTARSANGSGPPTSVNAAAAAAAAKALSWPRFLTLLLVPDLGMVGFLRNPRLGSWIYNVTHWEVLPSVLVVSLLADALSYGGGGGGASSSPAPPTTATAIAATGAKKDDNDDATLAGKGGRSGVSVSAGPFGEGARSVSWAKYMGLGLVWLCHIGMDRMIGAGLKYETGFGHTHVGVM